MDRENTARIILGKDKELDFTEGPLIMGIINCTPDSFYPGSRNGQLEKGLETALEMISAGADILDIGGESSRPGSAYIDADTEISRVVPLIKAIRKRSDVPISVDTRKSSAAESAVDAGADIINDISALSDDPELALLAADRGLPVILMHKRGVPLSMQNNPEYSDTVEEVLTELLEAADTAAKAGIPADRIIIDPGIGFGKRHIDNLLLIREIKTLKAAGYPVLVGLSRKSFLGKILSDDSGVPRPVEDRLSASIAGNAFAMLSGADILRVHDVKETADMVRVLKALVSAGAGEI